MENTKTKKRITKEEKLRGSKENVIPKLDEDRIIKEIENDALFINKTQQSEKIINSFYKFHKRKIKRSDFYTLLFCGAILIGTGINYLLKGDDYFFGLLCNIVINVSLILLGIYLLIYSFKYQKYDKKESKKIYKTDISTFLNSYYFNDERVIIKNEEGTTERRYEDLENIYEARKFYCIMLSKNSGFVMSKDSFTKGNEVEFNKFIKKKMGRKFKRRCHRGINRKARKKSIKAKNEINNKTIKIKKSKIKK